MNGEGIAQMGKDLYYNIKPFHTRKVCCILVYGHLLGSRKFSILFQGASMFETQNPHWSVRHCWHRRPHVAFNSLASGHWKCFCRRKGFNQTFSLDEPLSLEFRHIENSILFNNPTFQNLIRTDYFESVLTVLCVSEIIVRYFHLTTFFWMFLEGKEEFSIKLIARYEKRKKLS